MDVPCGSSWITVFSRPDMMCALLHRSLLLVFGMLTALSAGAMPLAPVAESEMKAAYLYNFAMFTTWPTDKNIQEGPLLFCVYADETQLSSITALQARKIRDRSIQIKRVELVEEVAGCHVLFVGNKSADLVPKLLDSVRDSATLTVTDVLDAAKKNAVISMSLENGRLAFDVNLQRARNAKLTLSSKLLKLARSAN